MCWSLELVTHTWYPWTYIAIEHWLSHCFLAWLQFVHRQQMCNLLTVCSLMSSLWYLGCTWAQQAQNKLITTHCKGNSKKQNIFAKRKMLKNIAISIILSISLSFVIHYIWLRFIKSSTSEYACTKKLVWAWLNWIKQT